MIEWLVEQALFPFTPLGGQDRISPYNNNAIYSRQIDKNRDKYQQGN